ncbi:hypothetical protein PSQ20_14815 [Curvibacter sp. RS43]|uniref:alpha/beta hydrolase family protein n=1 Tax=Curvibacter microcysteis TaxID=3026419 RepID=UPI00235E74F4|nr:hypothetical protein [Curvibacter sp. RS43]MDD0811626.1 hypothetical protein [Curvibacter sp. RS43]
MSFQASLKSLARPAARALGALALLAAVGSAQAFQSGFRSLTVAGPEPIPVALFYPTEAPARALPMGPWSPVVAPGAPAVARFKGLILLSHGTGGSELGHHNLATRLAQEGYLVAAPRHPQDDWQSRALVRSGQYFGERARQASRVLDAVLADPAWAERIPAGRIGALGHSAGGYTVLALAVGSAVPARAGAHCRTVRDDPGFCQLGQLSATGSAAPAEAPREGPVQVGDARVQAVLAMAPVGVVFAPEALSQVRRPVKVYTAEHDEVLNSRYHGQYVAGAVPGAEAEPVKGAGHFAFMAAPLQSLRSDAGDPGADPAGFDRAAFQARLAEEVVAFFNRSLP